MSNSSALRTLKIKTGVVDRTLRELASYQKELDENKKSVEAVRASDDHSKLKQWENVLGETQGMIPDTKSRLSNAVDELNALVENALPEDGYEGSPELERAETALASASSVLVQQ